MKKETLYCLMAASGQVIFGFSFLFSKVALDYAEPFILLSVRSLVAVITMLLVGKLLKKSFKISPGDIPAMLMLGLLQPVFYFIGENYGLKYTSTSFSGIVISLLPIFGLIFSGLLLKEYPTKLQVCSSVLSVVGVIIMTVNDSLGVFNIKGTLLLIFGCISGALYNIQSRKIAGKYGAFERTFYMFLIGFTVFTLMGIITSGGKTEAWLVPITTPVFWAAIVYLACISSVGAFMLLNKALDVLDVTRVTGFGCICTVITVLAGVFLLNEKFTVQQVVGILFALIGLYGVNKFKAKE